jgi:hypothetical protein
VGKIIDSGILLARKILLNQNQLCNGPNLTLFESLIVFLLMAIVLGMTDRNHKEEATIEHLLSLTLVAGSLLLAECLCNFSGVTVE